jgi:hypothetical protein
MVYVDDMAIWTLNERTSETKFNSVCIVNIGFGLNVYLDRCTIMNICQSA